jgi:large subunit ribosomal protein L25
MADFVLNARERNEVGKGASRRLRRLAKEVPAIVYGGKSRPQNIALSHNEVSHALSNEAYYSHILTLNIGENSEDVILKDVQRHPARPIIHHIDFMRVSKTQKLTTRVPLHFINEETCFGVKTEGGIIAHIMSEIEIECLPADLPEYIEVDMGQLSIGQMLHLSDLALPSGVESVELQHGEEHDQPVATVNKRKEEEELEELDTGEEGSEDIDSDASEHDTEGESDTDD